MHGLAATFGISGVNVDVVGAAGLEIVDGEDGRLARLIVNRSDAGLAGLAVHLHREFLRQPAVEALDALHVDRVGRLIQQ